MGNGISRREFAAGVAALGALAAAGAKAGQGTKNPDLVVATSPETGKNVSAVIAALGGMKAFVKKGQTVGLLMNYLCTIPAGRTKDAVIRAVVTEIRNAGGKEILALDWAGAKGWERSGLMAVIDDLGVVFAHTDRDDQKGWVRKDVPKGKTLTEVRLMKSLWRPDVLISLPAFKQHSGCDFSGALKLSMAVSHPEDNQQVFHREESKHLEQCIADLNTVVRPPDLIVTEAMEVLTSNGPFGPGDTAKPQKVVAGVDRVAIDAYCAPIQKVDPKKSIQVRAAAKHGLGQADLAKLSIKAIAT